MINKKYFINIVAMFFITMISMPSTAYTSSFNEQLNKLEKLSYTDADLALKGMKNLEIQVNFSTNKEKLRWIILAINTASLANNYPAIDYYIERSQSILDRSKPINQVWLELLLSGKLFVQGRWAEALPSLQQMESTINSFDDSLLTAYYNYMLYYAYLGSQAADIALDIAITNYSQWQDIEEYYLALNMLLHIANLRLNFQDFKEVQNAIVVGRKQATELEANNLLIAFKELEARSLIAQGAAVEAKVMLTELLERDEITPKHDRFLGVLENLATANFQLKNYKEAVDNIDSFLEHSQRLRPDIISNAKIMMAEALIELKQFERAQAIIDEVLPVYKANNDIFGLFKVDNINLDLYYKNNDIDALYNAAKSIVKAVRNYSDSQGAVRSQRSTKVAHAEEQSQVVEALALENEKKQQKLSLSQQLIKAKNQYLMVLSIFIILLVGLLIWTFILLKKIRTLANTDSLTGILNRRAGLELAETLFKKSKNRTGDINLSVAILDLDKFKSINDTYGHDIGDSVLKATVKTIEKLLGEGDIFCRLGGEEFLLLLANKEPEKARVIYQKIVDSIANFPYQKLGLSKAITTSIGVTNVRDDLSLDAAIIEADTALYQAKGNGRNQIVTYHLPQQ
ncbi:GGDEF domain-containing protein [Thalassotalea ganghwensis]